MYISFTNQLLSPCFDWVYWSMFLTCLLIRFPIRFVFLKGTKFVRWNLDEQKRKSINSNISIEFLKRLKFISIKFLKRLKIFFNKRKKFSLNPFIPYMSFISFFFSSLDPPQNYYTQCLKRTKIIFFFDICSFIFFLHFCFNE